MAAAQRGAAGIAQQAWIHTARPRSVQCTPAPVGHRPTHLKFLTCAADVEYTLARSRYIFDEQEAYMATAYSVRDRLIESWNDTQTYFKCAGAGGGVVGWGRWASCCWAGAGPQAWALHVHEFLMDVPPPTPHGYSFTTPLNIPRLPPAGSRTPSACTTCPWSSSWAAPC